MRFSRIFLLIVLSVSLTSCSNQKDKEIEELKSQVEELKKASEENAQKIIIPDISTLDKDNAISLLINNNLIPVVMELNDEKIKEGCAIKTIPSAGSSVEPNSKVTLYVSKGPEIICSEYVTFQWHNLGSKDDDWDKRISAPILVDDELIFTCNPIMSTSFTWRKPEGNYDGYGVASLNDKFDKSVPLHIVSRTGNEIIAGEEADFDIVVPVKQLEVARPTDLYVDLYITVNGKRKSLILSFQIEWKE